MLRDNKESEVWPSTTRDLRVAPQHALSLPVRILPIHAMSQASDSTNVTEGSAFPWVLEHLLAYPGSYEIPLRTMYTLNATSHNHQQSRPTGSARQPGNAFPKPPTAAQEEQQNLTTATAAAQLRANLMTHISQLHCQPTSLPPSFITSFVRKCFPAELEYIDFPQALTALDYLKDLENRRRKEVLAALDKLGIDRSDIGNKTKLANKYPGVLKWLTSIEEKERDVEAAYTQVYVGLRRWTLVNEMSLTPFNKANCMAMLNTLYPPNIPGSQFRPPTAQLTHEILMTQRASFFRYIGEVEKRGKSVLSNLINQHKRPGDPTGWPRLRETLDQYLRAANVIIDECYEVTGKGYSPTAASFSSTEYEEESRRKIDSGISFGSSTSSNRNSAQSHATRPSTSTSSSVSNHSRKQSREKQLPEKPLPTPLEDDEVASSKPAGSTLERIARELRKIKSKSNMRSASRSRAATAVAEEIPEVPDLPKIAPTPTKDRTLRFKRSLKKMRSTGILRDVDGNSRPSSSRSEADVDLQHEIPNFDAEEMGRRRRAWEEEHARKGSC